ncbi:phage terminase small subunit [Paenibacillus popilliae]|uniref:Uncharacterized conserved protein n=1 Tax=Paenibacillus popilliae ATCC 14706 TaxID=1212764 RepID=M9LLN9_PAEPP|nr:phage terminase small subunit [Paenibacillus popilliae]GAC44230.1 uncharacterized conserved protein [Paenibacillus popilliae ATCC 14706]
MAGQKRNPNRDEAKQRWLESDGEATNAEFAELAGVPESRIRKWKCEDKWEEALKEQRASRKPGGQPGNQNAKGHGAPKRNENAVTHGAYKTVYFDELSESERILIEQIDLDTKTNMLRELQTLVVKENDLKKRIAQLETESETNLHVDRVIEMMVPNSNEKLAKQQDKLQELTVQRDELVWEMESVDNPTKQQQKKLDKLEREIEELRDMVSDAEREDTGEAMKLSMQTVIKASPFERALKLRTELDKTHGRIIRLLDSVKAYELESRRLELEERKYRLAKQKVTGEFNINPETGEIDDTTDDENDEI